MYSNANTWYLPALNVSNLARPSETMNGRSEPCHEHITMAVYPALVPSNSHTPRSGLAPAVLFHPKSPVRMAVLACLACPVRTDVCLLSGADAAFRTTEIQSCWPQSCLMAHSSLFNCSDGLRSSQDVTANYLLDTLHVARCQADPPTRTTTIIFGKFCNPLIPLVSS